MGTNESSGVTEARGILDSGGRSGGAVNVRHRERLLCLRGRTESADPGGHAARGPAIPARKA